MTTNANTKRPPKTNHQICGGALVCLSSAKGPLLARCKGCCPKSGPSVPGAPVAMLLSGIPPACDPRLGAGLGSPRGASCQTAWQCGHRTRVTEIPAGSRESLPHWGHRTAPELPLGSIAAHSVSRKNNSHLCQLSAYHDNTRPLDGYRWPRSMRPSALSGVVMRLARPIGKFADGTISLVLPAADHRRTSFSATSAQYRFLSFDANSMDFAPHGATSEQVSKRSSNSS